MSEKLTCFKAYDIRGKLGSELNEDIVYRIGRAYGEYLKPKTVVVGGDVRLTSESLKLSLAQGLRDSGVDILDIGLSGTEEIYFATSHLKTDGGIEVTASHNPMDYNGLKLVSKDSKPISGDSGLNAIRELAESNNFSQPCVVKGNYTQVNILDHYLEKILGFINLNNLKKPMKLVINIGNGAAGHVIDAIEKVFLKEQVPITFIKVHEQPDGNFPNGIPNPLLPECRKDTADAVILHKADMGIAFDGDFDRCFLFDEKGNFIEGYYIVALLAEAFLKSHPKSKIIHDPRLSWNTIDVVNTAGGTPIVTKTGHAFIKEKMRVEDAIYGGEMSAHHYFRDFYYCDSGMIPWLLVTELLSLTSSSLGDMVRSYIQKYPSSGEINLKLNNPNLAIDNVIEKYKDSTLNIDRIDGVSLEFDSWRFNLRTSNTEPVVRLNVESRGNINLMQEKTNEITNFLKNF